MSITENPLYAKLFTDGALMLDNTSLETIITCPRRAYYYLIRKRESDGKKEPLNFGSAIHEALAHRYNNPTLYADAGLREASIAAALSWFEANPQPEDAWRTPDLAVRVIQKYYETYMAEPFVVNSDDKGLIVERSFAIPIGVIGDIPVIWTGKLDLDVTLEGGEWLADHKTTSMLGAQYFQQFQNASQFIGYSWAMRQLTGRKPRGVLINAIAVRRPTKTGKEIEFARERVPISEGQVNEWQNNTMRIIATFLGYLESGYFPMHTAYCVNKFGLCPYFDVCTLPEEQREIMLGSRAFKDVTWSPLND